MLRRRLRCPDGSRSRSCENPAHSVTGVHMHRSLGNGNTMSCVFSRVFQSGLWVAYSGLTLLSLFPDRQPTISFHPNYSPTHCSLVSNNLCFTSLPFNFKVHLALCLEWLGYLGSTFWMENKLSISNLKATLNTFTTGTFLALPLCSPPMNSLCSQGILEKRVVITPTPIKEWRRCSMDNLCECLTQPFQRKLFPVLPSDGALLCWSEMRTW